MSENGKYMFKEIGEIQESLIKTLEFYKIKDNIKLPNNFYEMFNRVHIFACGSSFHGGLIGKKIIENVLNIPCEIDLANEIDSNGYFNSSTLYILASQSGETLDVINAFNLLHKKGLRTLCISNTINSTLAQKSTYFLPTFAGTENAIASTKAYNCEILAFEIFAYFVKSKMFKDFSRFLTKKINKINSYDFSNLYFSQIKECANLIKNYKTIYFLGSNLDYLFAKEVALKIKETCYINTISMPLKEIYHGTMAVFDESSLVVILNSEKENVSVIFDILKRLNDIGAKTVLFSSLSKKLYRYSPTSFVDLPVIPKSIFNELNIIPFQYLAYHTSLALNNNPDSPRRLVKSVK